MTQPATGETTPTTKRKRNTPPSAAVTPGDSVFFLTAALQAATDAVAAEKAASSHPMDAETDETDQSSENADEETRTANEPEPVPLKCSLLSLPPAFTSFAGTISKKVLAFMMSKRAKLRGITKLEIREIIPTPIRFQFDLSGSKEVTGNDDFFGLAAACSMAIQTCQADLKLQMIMAARMEIDVIDKKSRALFHHALQGFAQLILIESATGPVCTPTTDQVRLLALSTLDINVEHFTMPHNFGLDPVSLFSDYKSFNDDPLPIWTQGCADIGYCTDHSADIELLTSLMYDTIAQRWLDKLNAMNEKEKAALLESTQLSFSKTKSTKEAADAIALETTMDETKMDSVIANKVAIENKALRSKIDNLEALIRRTTINDDSKNSGRGANTARASQQKTNLKKKATQQDASKRKTPAKQNRRGKPAAAAAPASATSSNGTAAKGKKKTKKPPGKGTKRNVAFAT
jgi:hypothetical protein